MKKRIVIASVLKPVSDTRMTEKIAATLCRDERLDVHVIGYPAAYSPNEKITLHTFEPFARMSLRRLTMPLKILRMIRALRPSVIIVTTHELLGIALLAKLLTRTKVVYDVQENYYLNILHTNAFNFFLKYPIAIYVRLKETVARSWVDHFFLAEEVYHKQLNFANGRSTVLVNKVTEGILPGTQIRNPLALLFSGTLSRSTGVIDAIVLAKGLHKIEPGITLTIIGHASLESEVRRIRTEIHSSPFITLIGGENLVNHEEIVQSIARSGAGIIAYELNPATEGRIPTKLFEYIGAGLPIIFLRAYPTWLQLASQVDDHFTVVNLSNIDHSLAIQWLTKPKPRGTIPDSIFWKSEEGKLKTALSAL